MNALKHRRNIIINSPNIFFYVRDFFISKKCLLVDSVYSYVHTYDCQSTKERTTQHSIYSSRTAKRGVEIDCRKPGYTIGIGNMHESVSQSRRSWLIRFAASAWDAWLLEFYISNATTQPSHTYIRTQVAKDIFTTGVVLYSGGCLLMRDIAYIYTQRTLPLLWLAANRSTLYT